MLFLGAYASEERGCIARLCLYIVANGGASIFFIEQLCHLSYNVGDYVFRSMTSDVSALSSVNKYRDIKLLLGLAHNFRSCIKSRNAK